MDTNQDLPDGLLEAADKHGSAMQSLRAQDAEIRYLEQQLSAATMKKIELQRLVRSTTAALNLEITRAGGRPVPLAVES